MKASLTCDTLTCVLWRGYEDVVVSIGGAGGMRAAALAKMPGYENLREKVWDKVSANFVGGLNHERRSEIREHLMKLLGGRDAEDAYERSVLKVPLSEWTADLALPDPQRVFVHQASHDSARTVVSFCKPTLIDKRVEHARFGDSLPPWWWAGTRFVIGVKGALAGFEDPGLLERLRDAVRHPPGPMEVVQIEGVMPRPMRGHDPTM